MTLKFTDVTGNILKFIKKYNGQNPVILLLNIQDGFQSPTTTKHEYVLTPFANLSHTHNVDVRGFMSSEYVCVGTTEENVLENYFVMLSKFNFERAKEQCVRNHVICSYEFRIV